MVFPDTVCTRPELLSLVLEIPTFLSFPGLSISSYLPPPSLLQVQPCPRVLPVETHLAGDWEESPDQQVTLVCLL